MVFLQVAGDRAPLPILEIHRVGYEGSGGGRRLPLGDDPQHFERLFSGAFQASVRCAGIQVEVYIWNDFHDRYLIHNLNGISLPNWFGTTPDPNSITHWTQLGRDDRDDVQREFDPACGRHVLRHRFPIG